MSNHPCSVSAPTWNVVVAREWRGHVVWCGWGVVGGVAWDLGGKININKQSATQNELC